MTMRDALRLLLALTLALLSAAAPAQKLPGSQKVPGARTTQDWARRLVNAAIERTHHHVTYDSAYRAIAYPGGDVSQNTGVCADVVIRAYRALGVDLQVLVHKDMEQHFQDYPNRWNLKHTDTNIDHRRVPNLRTFFRRHGAALPVSDKPGDYRPGDLVTWEVPPHLPHIGIVTHRRSSDGTPLIVHNIGRGPQLENMLFTYRITGHYRFRPQ